MKKGFTLVEILVAVTIFVIVVTVASSLFVQTIRGQRRNLAYQELLGQTSYLMEYMSRSIRMAIKDDIESRGETLDCLSGNRVNYETANIAGASCLYFRNYKNECQYFCLDGTKLVTATATPSGPLNFIDLTSPDLTVSSFNITSQGWGPPEPPWNDDLQPLVGIFLEIGCIEQPSIKIQLQTKISQRNLDI